MSLTGCLVLAAVVFATGLYGLVTRRNMVALLLAIELLLTAGIINTVAFARWPRPGADAVVGTAFPLFIIALTACEIAIGLALVVALHRERRQIDVEQLRDLHD